MLTLNVIDATDSRLAMNYHLAQLNSQLHLLAAGHRWKPVPWTTTGADSDSLESVTGFDHRLQ